MSMGAWAIVLGLLLVGAAPTPTERFPEPPLQRAPWIAPRSELPRSFTSAVARLFEQGLPDPRGCEYRMVRIKASPEELDSLGMKQTLAGPILFTRVQEYAFDVPGWVLPRAPGQSRRYAIQWNGVVYPVERIGRRADVAQDVEAALLAEQNSDQGLSGPILRACFLLRLGYPDLAYRCWQRILGGDRFAEWTQYSEPAQRWARRVYLRAVHDHAKSRDGDALQRLEMLHLLAPLVIREARSRGQLKEYCDDETALQQQDYAFFERVPALMRDQRRRAEQRLSRPLPARGGNSIAALVRDLENVDIQASQLDNPGYPELHRDPRVQALVWRGWEAVEPLIDVIADDRRLTRSIGYWRFFGTSGEMATVSDAASAALYEILGPEHPAEPLVGDPPAIPPSPTLPHTPEAYAESLRQRWRGMDEWRRNWGKRVYLTLRGEPLGRALSRICEGTNVRYTVVPELLNVRIARTFKGETVRQALREVSGLLRQKRPEAWLDEQGSAWAFLMIGTGSR